MWGQRFGAAAELPLGAELYVNAGSAGDLVAGRLPLLAFPTRVFTGAVCVDCEKCSNDNLNQ